MEPTTVDPKDRLETIARTKASARQEKADTRAAEPDEPMMNESSARQTVEKTKDVLGLGADR